MARITNQDGQDPTSIARVSGTTVENATAAWHVSGGVITQIFPPVVVVAPDPRNTYSNYVSSGPVINIRTSIVNGTPGPWVAGGGEFQFYATESRRIPVTTTTTGEQPQTRTCTATGGCDGPFTRTIPVTVSVIQSTRTETRQCDAAGTLCSTTNPNFVEEADGDDFAGFVTCSIDRLTGLITFGPSGTIPRDAEGFAVPLQITLAPGQGRSFDVIPFGGTRIIDRPINLIVNGNIPTGFRFEGSLIPSPGLAVTCTATQGVADRPPLFTDVNISWRDPLGTRRATVADGATRVLTGINSRTRYTISGRDSGLVYLGTGSFDTSIDRAGVEHTIIGTDGTFTDSITFTVISRGTSTVGGPEIAN